MPTPVVSVVIRCFNLGAYLAQAIDSALRQTYPRVEVIIVDDGSTDNTERVARGYGERVRYVAQAHSGVSAALNTGTLAATGDWINFLDADDVLLPDMLAASLDRQRLEDADVVWSGFIWASPDLADRSWVVQPQIEGEPFSVLAHGNPFAIQSVVVRRELLAAVGGFDVGLRGCEDWDMWQRLSRCLLRWAAVPRALSLVRMRPRSMNRDPLPMFEAAEEVIRRAHRPDPRISPGDAQHRSGCPCSSTEGLWSCVLAATAFALAQGKPKLACDFLAEKSAALARTATPADMTRIIDGLWFGTATPKGNWPALWSIVKRPLTEFLLCHEERCGFAGLTAESLYLLFRREQVAPQYALTEYSGWLLVREVADRALTRVGLSGPRLTKQ